MRERVVDRRLGNIYDSRMLRTVSALVKLVLSGVFISAPLAAQSTFATITGVVTDPAGAAAPNTAIEAINQQTNYKYSATTNESGQYTLPNLLDGKYNIVVNAQGFQSYRTEGVLLSVREQRRLDIQLKIGDVATTVDVTAAASLIETETARISDVKDRTVLRNLPLTLRRAW
ncbi:MAG: carboxypeptidase-like regulatory domain-containing protein, partial [Bryobacteraceae bacterium]